MGNIIVLDENTSNKIAAGEVVENSASVVKELLENSMDAKADSIQVEIKNGGKSYIKVTDNGTGIKSDDIKLAFERHATSKIKTPNDLESVMTFGFRGEALASIAAVSQVEVISKTSDDNHGIHIEVDAGEIKNSKQTGRPTGTTFIVKNLFYNTPARFKFLKKDRTEAGYISDIVNRIALGNPKISFKLVNNGKTVLHTPGNNDLLSTIFSIYGKQIARNVIDLYHDMESVKVYGYIGVKNAARANRRYQSVYINKRYIKSGVISAAIDESCKSFITKNKYAFAVLNIEVNPVLVDVNVHPAKREVKFSNEKQVFKCVYTAIRNALYNNSEAQKIKIEGKKSQDTEHEKYSQNTPGYKQQKYTIEDNSNKFIYTSGKNITTKPEANKDRDDIKRLKAPGISHDDVEKEYTKKRNIKKIRTDRADTGKTHSENKRTEFLHYSKILGQLFETYIILEYDNELILVDQHAAHERIMFEKLKEKYKNNETLSQMLLDSEVIEVTYQELEFLREQKEIFNKLGFTYENFGNNSIILRSVPYMAQNVQINKMFRNILDCMMNSVEKEYSEISDEQLFSIACRISVKANKKLDEIEINNVLKELAKMKNPFNCPHGRPTVIKISKYEIEKMFKRKL